MLQFEEKSIEERAFFYKIVGDYYRYAAEATTPVVNGGAVSDPSQSQKEIFKKGALDSYQKCMNISKKGLKPYNCVRLGLALNYSVFQYEIMQDPINACKIAKDSLDQAQELLDECEANESPENYKEAHSIINCLNENLNAWES